MKILIIEGIYGRFTNYILTIMQSIYYSLEHNINYIKFDYQHKDYNYADIFKIQNIDLNNTDTNNNEVMQKSAWEMYFTRNLGNNDTYLFNKYLRNNFYVDLNKPTSKIVLYVRGEDIFIIQNKNYTQPPLYFYTKCIEMENATIIPIMVSQDLINPVANFLNQHKQVSWKEQNFKDDLETLLNCEILIFGYSTIIYIVLLLSKKLKHLYLPRYAYDWYIKDHKFNFTDLLQGRRLTIIELPNYLGIGEFEYTREHLDLLLSYKPHLLKDI
jgi:hypothetical protein